MPIKEIALFVGGRDCRIRAVCAISLKDPRDFIGNFSRDLERVVQFLIRRMVRSRWRMLEREGGKSTRASYAVDVQQRGASSLITVISRSSSREVLTRLANRFYEGAQSRRDTTEVTRLMRFSLGRRWRRVVYPVARSYMSHASRGMNINKNINKSINRKAISTVRDGRSAVEIFTTWKKATRRAASFERLIMNESAWLELGLGLIIAELPETARFLGASGHRRRYRIRGNSEIERSDVRSIGPTEGSETRRGGIQTHVCLAADNEPIARKSFRFSKSLRCGIKIVNCTRCVAPRRQRTNESAERETRGTSVRPCGIEEVRTRR